MNEVMLVHLPRLDLDLRRELDLEVNECALCVQVPAEYRIVGAKSVVCCCGTCYMSLWHRVVNGLFASGHSNRRN